MSQSVAARHVGVMGLIPGLAISCWAIAPVSAGDWTLGAETRFIAADGGLLINGQNVGDDQSFLSPQRAAMDAQLIVDLKRGTGTADAFAYQTSIVEQTRLVASGNADASVLIPGIGDSGVANARSKYEVQFTLTQPTRLRFEVTVGETGLGQAWVEIRRGLFEVVRRVASDQAETSLNEFIVLPAGTYVVHAETQLSTFSFQPAMVSGTGEYSVLLAPSNATLVGDLNCDGIVSVGDIGAFVLALTDPAAYAQQFPTCATDNGDINADGVVSVGDIGALVQLLVS